MQRLIVFKYMDEMDHLRSRLVTHYADDLRGPADTIQLIANNTDNANSSRALENANLISR
jgi:hypothetical protein